MEVKTVSAATESTGSRTMADVVALAAERNADRPALRHKRGDEWVDVSYRELAEAVREVALGLVDLGADRGDKIAILSHTRPEWTVANLGILGSGATSVSIYQTNSAEECPYVLEHYESRGVFCEDASQLAKIREVESQLPNLEWIFVMDPEGTDDLGNTI